MFVFECARVLRVCGFVGVLQFACPIRIRETHGSAALKRVGLKPSAGGGVNR